MLENAVIVAMISTSIGPVRSIVARLDEMVIPRLAELPVVELVSTLVGVSASTNVVAVALPCHEYRAMVLVFNVLGCIRPKLAF